MHVIGNMSPLLTLWSPVVFIYPQSTLLTLCLELFLVLQIFLPTSNSHNRTVCAQFCTLPLSVPETAMGVTLNAQQHSDSEYVQAIHRWEMGVCWGEYCGCCLLDSVWTVVSDLVHKRSLCAAERGRLFYVQGWELIVPQITANWYKNIYSSLCSYSSNKSIWLIKM